MGIIAFVIVIMVAIAAGFAVQRLAPRVLPYHWLLIALVTAFGAYFASENIPGATAPLLEWVKDWGPTIDGMYLIPAILGGVILAVVMYFGTRADEGLQPA